MRLLSTAESPSHRLHSSGILCLTVKALDLEFTKLDCKSLNEFFKHVVWICHELLSLLLRHRLAQENIWSFVVWKEKDKDPEGVSRDFNQVDGLLDLMKVSVEHLSLRVDAEFHVISQRHGWWPFLGYYIYLILLRRNVSESLLLWASHPKTHGCHPSLIQVLLAYLEMASCFLGKLHLAAHTGRHGEFIAGWASCCFTSWWRYRFLSSSTRWLGCHSLLLLWEISYLLGLALKDFKMSLSLGELLSLLLLIGWLFTVLTFLLAIHNLHRILFLMKLLSLILLLFFLFLLLLLLFMFLNLLLIFCLFHLIFLLDFESILWSERRVFHAIMIHLKHLLVRPCTSVPFLHVESLPSTPATSLGYA